MYFRQRQRQRPNCEHFVFYSSRAHSWWLSPLFRVLPLPLHHCFICETLSQVGTVRFDQVGFGGKGSYGFHQSVNLLPIAQWQEAH